MAKELGVNTLRYLNVSDLGPCLDIDQKDLCVGCVRGKYPTPCGNRLYKESKKSPKKSGRTYE